MNRPASHPDDRARRTAEAASILGVERLTLELPDRILADDQQLSREGAALIREHQPHTVDGIGEAPSILTMWQPLASRK